MSADPEIVVLTSARTPFEVKIILSVLQEAGITASVDPDMLQDEYAVSQRLLNTQGVRIRIRRDQVEAAREALERADTEGREMLEGDIEVEGEGGGEPEGAGSDDRS